MKVEQEEVVSRRGAMIKWRGKQRQNNDQINVVNIWKLGNVYFTILKVEFGDKWQYNTKDDRLRILHKLSDSGKTNSGVDISGCEESLRRFVSSKQDCLRQN